MNERFSERMGFTQPRTVLQIEGMDDALRNSLWNLLSQSVMGYLDSRQRIFLARHLVILHFKLSLETVSLRTGDAADQWIHRKFFEAQWFEVYDILEAIFSFLKLPTFHLPYGMDLDKTEQYFNTILEREKSAYRLINGRVTPITHPAEIAAISAAVHNVEPTGFKGVYEHLDKAQEHFSRRLDPDYHNTIKEAISAVESLLRVLTGKDKPILSDLLKRDETLHPALKDAFVRLYGYASDEQGIRHSKVNGRENVTHAEAKFMLVACHAFVSYAIEKYGDLARSS